MKDVKGEYVLLVVDIKYSMYCTVQYQESAPRTLMIVNTG